MPQQQSKEEFEHQGLETVDVIRDGTNFYEFSLLRSESDMEYLTRQEMVSRRNHGAY